MAKSTDTGTRAHRPVLAMELNELCPPIIDRMMASGDLPNFKALHATSDVHVTWADDPDLEPWVQWVTLHTGRPQDVHGATELDEGYRVDLPRVWDMLGDQGHRSLVFGSMNSRALSEKVFLVPDPWSVRVQPTEAAYQAFHNFIAFNVTEHTNARAKPSKAMVLGFVRFMVSRGLSISTVITAVRQILDEKTQDRDLKWRRAMILDLLMWDVFEKEYRKQQPDFATYFANSTAFLQHRYWRHMDPGAYQVKPSEGDMKSYGSAVEDSYRHMDKLVGRAMKLVGPSGRIVFVTALSQEANLRYEHIGGKFVYRPHSFEALNRFIGGPADTTFEPVMTHQAWASFKSSSDADAFERAINENALANGAPVIEYRRTDDRVFFWCRFISTVDADMEVLNPKTGQRMAFSALFASLGQVNNSQHNRSGCFWIQRDDGRSVVHPDRLPLTQATKKLLDLFPMSPSSLQRAA